MPLSPSHSEPSLQNFFDNPFQQFWNNIGNGFRNIRQSVSMPQIVDDNDTLNNNSSSNNENANTSSTPLFDELNTLFTLRPRRLRDRSTNNTRRTNLLRRRNQNNNNNNNDQNQTQPYQPTVDTSYRFNQSPHVHTQLSQSESHSKSTSNNTYFKTKSNQSHYINAQQNVTPTIISPNFWIPDENWPDWMKPGKTFLPTAHQDRLIKYIGLEFQADRSIKGVVHCKSAKELINDVRSVREENDNHGMFPHLRLPKVFTNNQQRKDNPITLRDLRVLNPKSTMTASVAVKDGALVVVLQPLKAIITYKKAYLFGPDSQYVRGVIRTITQKVNDQNQKKEIERQNFETIIFDSFLIYATLYLEKQYARIEPNLKNTLRLLEHSEANTERNLLEKLRKLEIQLKQHHSDTRDLYDRLNEVLEEEDKVKGLNLTSYALQLPDLDDDENEMSYVLTQNLPWILSLTSKAKSLRTSIEATLDYLEIRMNQAQNELLLVNLSITAIMTALSFCTAITAVFGMNFRFPTSLGELPQSQYWFYGCIVFLIITSSVGLYLIRWWCIRKGLFKAKKRIGIPKGNREKLLDVPILPNTKGLITEDNSVFGRRPRESALFD